MSPFRFAIRLGLAALAVCAGFSASAIELRRGVNFELWQHWTSRSAFVAADYDRTNFPDWSKAITDTQLARLRAQGFDFVRLNVDPSPFFWIEADGNKLLDAVLTATHRLQAADFKVIVDLHLVPDMDDRPNGLHWVLGTGDVKKPEGFARYTALVGKVAGRLATLPADRTALEVMNEPDQDWFSHLALTDRWPEQLRTLHAAARAAAPQLPLILSGARGGDIDGLMRLDPGKITDDANVIWSFHYYEPYEITHSGLPWESDARHFLVGLPFPAYRLDFGLEERLRLRARAAIDAEVSAASARAALYAKVDETMTAFRAAKYGPDTIDAAFGRAAGWATDHDIAANRLLLGEFGVFQDHVALDTRAAILAAMRQAAEAHGFAWAVYTAGLTQPHQSFSIIGDPATLAVEPEIATALGLR